MGNFLSATVALGPGEYGDENHENRRRVCRRLSEGVGIWIKSTTRRADRRGAAMIRYGRILLDGVLWNWMDSGVALVPLKTLPPGYQGVASFQA